MYEYKTLRANTFTEEGQVMFLRIRDHLNRLLATSGAARMQEILRGAGSGSNWDMMACVDRLVELGEIIELTDVNKTCGQARVFISRRDTA